jgi:hypothetical protein
MPWWLPGVPGVPGGGGANLGWYDPYAAVSRGSGGAICSAIRRSSGVRADRSLNGGATITAIGNGLSREIDKNGLLMGSSRVRWSDGSIGVHT